MRSSRLGERCPAEPQGDVAHAQRLECGGIGGHVGRRPREQAPRAAVLDLVRLPLEEICTSSAQPMRGRSRPAASAMRLTSAMPAPRRAGVSSGFVWLLLPGYQASPSLTARRSAAGLSPPTQMGGWGFCRGLG